MTVLYRKYRPGKIEEIDSEFVRQRLEVILSSGRVPHAFLFTGPKGTGKTSAARIVAKSVNCGKTGGRGEPCGKCPSCTSISGANNLDVLEIDAASNRGIDEIRELREKIRLAPVSAPKKVYIIDEAHMLTAEAFNALLKTLEEPPPHAIFILCTTAVEKVPETIVSRCVKLDFRRASQSDLLRSLRRVKRGERREIEEEALEVVAQLAEGSYRDAHKLLEEILISFPRAKITAEIVRKTLGKEEFLKKDILGWLVARDAKSALLWLGDAVERGAELRLLTSAILEVLQSHLLQRYGIIKENFVYEEYLEKIGIAELKDLIFLFSRAAQELKTTIIPQLPLELAIVEWCEGESSGGGVLPLVSPPAGGLPDSRHPAASSKIVARHPSRGLEEFENRWEEIILAVKPQNHSVAGLLRSCRPASFDSQTLVIEAFYKFHFERLSEPKIKTLLEKVIQNLFAKKIKISPRLEKKGGKND